MAFFRLPGGCARVLHAFLRATGRICAFFGPVLQKITLNFNAMGLSFPLDLGRSATPKRLFFHFGAGDEGFGSGLLHGHEAGRLTPSPIRDGVSFISKGDEHV